MLLLEGVVYAPEEIDPAKSWWDPGNPLYRLHPEEPSLGKGWRGHIGQAGTGEARQCLAQGAHQSPAQGAHQQPGWGVHRGPPSGGCPSCSSEWCLSFPP